MIIKKIRLRIMVRYLISSFALILPLSVLAQDIDFRIISTNEKYAPQLCVLGKKVLTAPEEGLWSVATKWENDWPAMRYTDVILIFSEATNEVDGPGASIYDAINKIRSRADIKMPPLPDGLTQSQMRERIRHERRIELAFEGFKYDDLKRWKIAEQVLNIPASESVIAKTFVKKNYHLPLSQSEIYINQGVLAHNPDYQ